MSFLAKLLIFVGWMLIFPEGIVDSSPTKGSTKLLSDLIGKAENYRSSNSRPNLAIIDGFPLGSPHFPTKVDHRRDKRTVSSDNCIMSWIASFSPDNISEAELCSKVGRVLDSVNLTELDQGLNRTLAAVGENEKAKKVLSRLFTFGRDLQKLASGGSTAANHSKGLAGATITTVIAVVVLHLGSPIVSSSANWIGEERMRVPGFRR